MKHCERRNDHWSLIPHLCTCQFYITRHTHKHPLHTHSDLSVFFAAISDVFCWFTPSVFVCVCGVKPAWCIVCELIPVKIFTAANLFNYTTN